MKTIWTHATKMYGAYVTDLRRETVRDVEGFTFRWHAAGSEVFAEALEMLKDSVPSHLREWREETREWWVERDVALEELPHIFSNFRGKVEALDLQGRLFG